MKTITVKLTTSELELLAALAADQLFRKEFIDSRIPGNASKRRRHQHGQGSGFPFSAPAGPKLRQTLYPRPAWLVSRLLRTKMDNLKTQFTLTGFRESTGYRVFSSKVCPRTATRTPLHRSSRSGAGPPLWNSAAGAPLLCRGVWTVAMKTVEGSAVQSRALTYSEDDMSQHKDAATAREEAAKHANHLAVRLPKTSECLARSHRVMNTRVIHRTI